MNDNQNQQDINYALENMWKAAKNAAEKVRNKDEKINDLENKIEFLTLSNNKKNEELSETKAEVEKLNSTIHQKNERIASQYNEIDDLRKKQEKLSQLEQNYIALLDENQIYKFESEKYIKTSLELENKKEENTILENKVIELENIKKNLEEKINVDESTKKNYEFAQKEIVTNKLELIEKNETIEKLKVKIFQLESSLINFDETKNKNKNLEEKENNLLAEIEKLKEEVSKIETQSNNEKLQLIARNIDKEEECKNIFSEKQFLQKIIEEKENEIEKLKDITPKNEELICQYIEKIQNQEEQNFTLEDKISLQENQINELNKANDILQSEKQKVEEINVKNTNKLNLLENYVEHLKDNLYIAQKDLDEEKKHASNIQKSNNELNKAINESNRKIEELVKEKNEDLIKINSLADSLKEAKNQLENLLIKNNELKNTLTHNKTDDEKVQQLKQENENLLEIVEEMTKKISDNEVALMQNYEEKIQFQKENENLQSELKKVEKLVKAFKKLSEKNEESINTIAELQKDLEYYKNRSYDENSLFSPENILAEQNNFELKIEKLKKENAETHTKNKQLSNKIIELNNKITELNDQITKLNNEKIKEEKPNVQTTQATSTEAEIANKLEGLLNKLANKL